MDQAPGVHDEIHGFSDVTSPIKFYHETYRCSIPNHIPMKIVPFMKLIPSGYVKMAIENDHL